MEYLSLTADTLQKGFLLITALLLIGQMLLGGKNELLTQLVAFSNAILILAATLYLVTAFQPLELLITTEGEYKRYSLINRITGPYWWTYWGALLFKGALPQLLWIKRLRSGLYASLALVPFLLAEYWLPRLLARHGDYLPSSWFMIQPSYHSLALPAIVYLIAFLLLFSIARRIKSK